MEIFVNEDYLNYKYLVEVKENYIVLTNKSTVNGTWQNPVQQDVIYQFLEPSTYVIEQTRTVTSEQTYQRIEVSSDFWDRADAGEIFTYGLIVTFFAIWIINILTRIVKRGGLLGN